MNRELTTLEVLGIAIRSEEDAARLYGGMAKRIKNELARAKFQALAKEEVSHRQLLLNLYERFSGEGAPPKIPGEPATAEGGAEPPAETSDLEQLMEFAIGREREAKNFYSEMSKKMSDANVKRLLQYLADIERGHEVMLVSELEAYRRDKNWYADNPDIQLV